MSFEIVIEEAKGGLQAKIVEREREFSLTGLYLERQVCPSSWKE